MIYLRNNLCTVLVNLHIIFNLIFVNRKKKGQIIFKLEMKNFSRCLNYQTEKKILRKIKRIKNWVCSNDLKKIFNFMINLIQFYVS